MEGETQSEPQALVEPGTMPHAAHRLEWHFATRLRHSRSGREQDQREGHWRENRSRGWLNHTYIYISCVIVLQYYQYIYNL